MRAGQLDWVAIGLGLNLKQFPEDTPYPASSIEAMGGTAPDNLHALYILAAAFEKFYQQWQAAGFASILARWRQVAQNFGQPITARLEAQELHGIFEDIDANGALILRTEDGARQVISAADVFFPGVNI